MLLPASKSLNSDFRNKLGLQGTEQMKTRAGMLLSKRVRLCSLLKFFPKLLLSLYIRLVIRKSAQWEYSPFLHFEYSTYTCHFQNT